MVDEDGKPVAKANVAAKNEDLYFSAAPEDRMEANTDEKGRYRINGIAPGRFSLTARADGFGVGSIVAKVEEGTPSVDVERIALKAARLTITGVVRDPNGHPLVGAYIVPFVDGRTILPQVMTDKGGRFTIEKLAEGKVFIQVIAGSLHGTAEVKAGDKDIKIIVQDGTKGAVAP